VLGQQTGLAKISRLDLLKDIGIAGLFEHRKCVSYQDVKVLHGYRNRGNEITSD
jgi:hypothetical protein